MTQETNIYDPSYVKDLFDRCSGWYRIWSQVASFGFVAIWRRQCVNALPQLPSEKAVGFDLMAGTGEAWPYLLKRNPDVTSIVAVDISSEMNRRALERLHRTREAKIRLIEADILNAELPAQSADFVISTFGMKTFNQTQQSAFAQEVARILKPGGVFSIIEASDPQDWLFRPIYRLYLERILPWIEKLFLRGAQDFSMIATYTKNFGDCRHLARQLDAAGLEVEFKSFFFGCATGVVGRRKVGTPT